MAATETTTIRVNLQTRNRLQREAQARGQSVAALLAELAERVERDRMIASEIEASRLDALNPAVADEEELWETTLADGID
jgi:predicted transcriptional regulator